MFEFLQRNFALVSAGLFGVSVTTIVVLVFSYLSVFDWTLIWILEYSDVAKFLLLAIALLFGVLGIVTPLAQNVYLWLANNSKSHRTAFLALLGVWALILAFNLISDYASRSGN